jgi:hypothetical protein
MDHLSLVWRWLPVVLLGAFHGVNPAMGWLFAVALGLQEGRGGAVVAALPPIALGHAIAIALVALPVGLLGLALPPQTLLLLGGAALLVFAAAKVATRFRHPRWVGMRVGGRDLALWSFLMASAHGSGLMLAPAIAMLAGASPTAALAADHSAHAAHFGVAAPDAGTTVAPALIAAAIHSGTTFLVMAAVALLVYRYLGVELLRRAWVNLDLLWVGALTITGCLSLGAGLWSVLGA